MRIAGPVNSAKAWKRSERRKRPSIDARILLRLPASRRRIALLSLITERFPDGLWVGSPGCPPLTDSIRDLLQRRLVSLTRQSAYGSATPRRNFVKVTNKGRAILAASKLDQNDRKLMDALFEADQLP